MNFTTTLTFIACICFIFIIGKIFIVPIKIIFKLIINSILGGFTIFLINFFAQGFDFHIGLNLFTAIFVGILGIPRCYYFSTYTIVSHMINLYFLKNTRIKLKIRFVKNIEILKLIYGTLPLA